MALHPALEAFEPLEEVTSHGHRTLLARSRSKNFVAIEVLVQGTIPDDISTALSRTASSTAKLTHESIVQARALVLEKDLAAVVTEFIPGVSLQRLLRFSSGRGVRLPDDVAFYILARVLTALAFAHDDADLVHGNVSPSSVIVGWDGKTKLGDFAGWKMRSLVRPIATSTYEDDANELLAPEVASGSERSQKSDVYGASLLALRLLTGRTPFARHRESKTELLIAMSEGKVSRIAKTRPDLSTTIASAIDRGLEADPEKRDVSARTILDAVAATFDMARGEIATKAILSRWKSDLEKSVTPWERRASRIDLENDAPPPSREHESQLAVSMPEDRPSAQSLVAEKSNDEPWSKDRPSAEESALGPTEANQSLSRVGATVSDALTMPPPLPSFRVTSPSLPTYGGPAVNLPVPQAKQTLFRGPFAAVIVIAVFVVLGIAAYVIMTKLTMTPVPH